MATSWGEDLAGHKHQPIPPNGKAAGGTQDTYRRVVSNSYEIVQLHSVYVQLRK